MAFRPCRGSGLGAYGEAMRVDGHTTNQRPVRWFAGLAAITLLVAACSGGGSSVSPADTAPETTPGATSDTASETTPDTAPETAPETAPDTAPETTPETTPAIVPSGVMCPPTPEGRIAYQLVLEDGGVDGAETSVQVVRPDGASDSQLIGGEPYFGLGQPTWSPDGTRAVVVTGDGQLLIVRCDGTVESALDPRMQTASFPISIGGASYPNWSPDGSLLSFVSADGLFIVDPADPISARQISLGSGLTVARGRASWSPDGDQLAFGAADSDGNTDIYVVGTDESGLTRLTTDPGDDYQPAWSPDGSTIAFRSIRDGRLWVMAADGSGQKPLFSDESAAFAYQPSWSPDGTQLVYVWGDAGDVRVHVIGADGSGDRQLTASTAVPRSESWPVWVSP